MKARARFYARGQSESARGIPFVAYRLFKLWPVWARQAYVDGWNDARPWKVKFRDAVLALDSEKTT